VLESGIVTGAAGCDCSTTVKVAVSPFSEVSRGLVAGLTMMPRAVVVEVGHFDVGHGQTAVPFVVAHGVTRHDAVDLVAVLHAVIDAGDRHRFAAHDSCRG
jgi:hypothetical protein